MSIAHFASRRRVTVLMAAVTGLLFGLISLGELSVDLLPELSYPTLTVRTEFAGAAPGEMETLISKPLEETLSVVKGVRKLSSVSRAGQSDIILRFDWGTDMDMASLDVREKLELVQLPLEIDKPVLLRFNPTTEPVLRLALSGDDNRSAEIVLREIRRFADEQLRRQLEPVESVAAVKISGGLEDEIQVHVDQASLARLGMTAEEVARALSRENVNISGGSLEQGSERFLIRTMGQFTEVGEIAELVVKVVDGQPVKISDLATISDSFKERKAIIRLDGKEAVELALYKEGDANTVKMAEAVHKRLERIRKKLPEGYQLEVIADQSVFVQQAISEVVQAAVLGGLLAVLVVYLFLGEALATVIIALSIPVSIITTFFLMNMTGVGLNIMSLGGVALAAGLLVDNAIVVLENISRLREQGKGYLEAAVEGAGEVTGAVIASTLTTIAVFLPLVFVSGLAGQLFRDQALTVTFALTVSLLVALSLIPMLASLKGRKPLAYPEEQETATRPAGKWSGRIWQLRVRLFQDLPVFIMKQLFRLAFLLAYIGKKVFQPAVWLFSYSMAQLRKAYASALDWSLGNRLLVLVMALVLMLLSTRLIPMLGLEVMPELAQGSFNIQMKLPAGAPLDISDKRLEDLQQGLQELPQVSHRFAVSGTGNRLDANPVEAGENIGRVLVNLNQVDETLEQQAKSLVRRNASRIPGAEVDFSTPAVLDVATPLEIEVMAYELPRLQRASEQIIEKLSSSSRFLDLKSSVSQGYPELRIFFDQERVAALGLTVRDLSERVVNGLRGQVPSRFTRDDRKIDMRVRLQETQRDSVEDVKNMLINPNSDRPVPLSTVADIRIIDGPAEIHRVDQSRVAIIQAGLAYGDLGSAVSEARELLSDLRFPPGVHWRITGQNEEMESSFQSLQMALLLAIFLVYIVMASQFESLLYPFVILFSIPLAAIGVLCALWLTGHSISVLVFIGCIMLAGIVVNNAIVLVDLINRLRDQGQPVMEAIRQAGELRLRPILMTTMTTVIGMLPLAMGLGEGAEIRAPMAVTVIGGLVFSTVLTLVLVPVIYSLLSRERPVTGDLG